MDYSQQLLNRITELAEELTPIREMAALLSLDEQEFVCDVQTIGSAARHAYMLGYATTANRLRKYNLELVKTGSPSADEACRNYLRKMEDL